MRFVELQTRPLTEAAPAPGTIITEKDTLIAQQVSATEADLYVTDDKGKALKVRAGSTQSSGGGGTTKDTRYVQKEQVDKLIPEMDEDKRIKFLESIFNGAYLADETGGSVTHHTTKIEFDTVSANAEVNILSRGNYYTIGNNGGTLTFFDNHGTQLTKVLADGNYIASVYDKDNNNLFKGRVFVPRIMGGGKSVVERNGVELPYAGNNTLVKFERANVRESDLKLVEFLIDESSFGTHPQKRWIMHDVQNIITLSPIYPGPLNLDNLTGVKFLNGSLKEKVKLYKNSLNKYQVIVKINIDSSMSKIAFIGVNGATETELNTPVKLTPAQIDNLGESKSLLSGNQAGVYLFTLDTLPERIVIKHRE